MTTNQFAPNATYRLVTREGITARKEGTRTILEVAPELLEALAREAFTDLAFHLRPSQFDQWVGVITDPEASENDRYVVSMLLKNAVIAAQGDLPLCQDTGTATVVGKRGPEVVTRGDDHEALGRGIRTTYQERNLRYSQIAAHSMFDEVNTGDNLPAQIDLAYSPGEGYHLLFMAKGGGSSNKTSLYQESKALLNPENLESFLREKVAKIGVAACPPYHLALVVGGTSPESNLKMLKLATAGALDHLPLSGDDKGRPFRDTEWEARLMRIASESGYGAQFGGKYMALDTRVIRLPRHAGSCPVSLGVSCSAHRNLAAHITQEGAFLEVVEKNPERHLAHLSKLPDFAPASIDLDQPMAGILDQLRGRRAGDLVLLSGPLIVGRDMAHMKMAEILRAEGKFPDWFTAHPIYYAGPAKTPPGKPMGSFGPTTAQRMDDYVAPFMEAGGSMVMLAKGNRHPKVAEACRANGGVYLGTIGGAAALLAEENIISSETVAFPELGMEAIRRIVVKDLPAFVITDAQGTSLY